MLFNTVEMDHLGNMVYGDIWYLDAWPSYSYLAFFRGNYYEEFSKKYSSISVNMPVTKGPPHVLPPTELPRTSSPLMTPPPRDKRVPELLSTQEQGPPHGEA